MDCITLYFVISAALLLGHPVEQPNTTAFTMKVCVEKEEAVPYEENDLNPGDFDTNSPGEFSPDYQSDLFADHYTYWPRSESVGFGAMHDGALP